MTRLRHQHLSFTLIEVLLALLIFTVAIVAIIEGTTEQVRAHQIAEETTTAVMLAESLLEQIKTEGDFSEREENGEFSGEFAPFDWEYRIEDTLTEGLVRARVAITWVDGRTERAHALETYLAVQP